MAKYVLTITRLSDGVMQKKLEGEQMGVLYAELVTYGVKKITDGGTLKGIEWVLNDYSTPKEKGSLIQMYGKFTTKGTPYIKGVGTKN